MPYTFGDSIHDCVVITYQSFGLNQKTPSREDLVFFGAGNQNRTDDLVITNDVLYRLSHTSISLDYDIIPNKNPFVKGYFEFF